MLKFTTAVATAAVALMLGPGAHAQDKVKIGYAVSMSGPNAAGAGITTIPNYKLWLHDLEAAGGLKVGDRRLPVEVVTYDDQSSNEELIKATERLINQDKVDLLLPPWGTAMNLAVGPTYNKYGYPHLAVTANTNRAYELGERWPNSFWIGGTSAMGIDAIVATLGKLKEAGKINDKIAMVSIADAFGIELATAARPALQQAGFQLVMDETYPLTTQDFSQLINQAKGSGADTFIAFSYPPDTFGLTGAAIATSYNPPVFFTAVGTAFAIFKDQLFHDNVDGVMGIGGVNVDDPKFQDYRKRHLEVTGQEPDRWASPTTYASLQILEQAIDQAGSLDKAAIIKALETGTFDTVGGTIKLDRHVNESVWWVGQWQNGDFHGIAPDTREGAVQPVVPKPAWKAAK